MSHLNEARANLLVLVGQARNLELLLATHDRWPEKNMATINHCLGGMKREIARLTHTLTAVKREQSHLDYADLIMRLHEDGIMGDRDAT